ncbi:FAD-binding protein [Criblamydia sequanensis]|uniref:Delta(24)-sterol reductase n=1 Tax=Candidatus Criblamydia sequanensis CRIB-18 TaxID=1437425 RepID=A0A090DZW0_9BACT|nr:FAD-binding protein [Criblamydia sequanensis]CDR34154.1 Conserved hypothetical protein [Criblamydia sequanensis CRIB-18]
MNRELDKIRSDFLKAKKDHLPISITRSSSASNTLRRGLYKNGTATLDLSPLNRLLNLNREDSTALIEPGLTMVSFFKKLESQGFMPKVLPEFKGITVGGAINGAAIESSSHRFGQFNNTCQSYRVLTGDGEIQNLSKINKEDLFYAISGSYGSLGLVLNATIEVEKIKPFVELSYHRFNSLDKALDFFKKASLDGEVDYLEGLVFSLDNTLIATAKLKVKRNSNLPLLSLKPYHSPWFYQHLHERSQDQVEREEMRLEDYLFRHDRAAFWMGGYALNSKILSRYILELVKLKAERTSLSKVEKGFDPMTKAPFWFRALFGWMMGSSRLYRFLHQDTEEWFANYFCIQDYYLPFSKTEEFIAHILKEHKIIPLWLCPVKKAERKELFSPHYQPGHEEKLLVDVGVYGMAKGTLTGREIVKDLDRLCIMKGGKKMLYSYSFLTEDEFWSIYSKKDYNSLREKYQAKESFVDIQKKVLERG